LAPFRAGDLRLSDRHARERVPGAEHFERLPAPTGSVTALRAGKRLGHRCLL